MKKIVVFAFLLLIIAGAGYALRSYLPPIFFTPQEPQGVERGAENGELLHEEIEVIAENLEIPWEIAFLPDGDLLVTERPGTLVRISHGGQRERHAIQGVRHIGEGGLLGMALHPDFEENRRVYLYMTTEVLGGLENRVERYQLEHVQLSDRTVIIDQIPGARFHDGGRIAFGPDGYLYITTGDAQDTQLAQDRDSLAGKILRITDEGDVPEGNPFGTPIYSYGHRNPQGLAWDGEGNLWATEHGPTARDELNLIEPGNNYGWPVITGSETRSGMETPVLYSGTDYTWAPSGAAHWSDSIFFGGLRGQAIYEAVLKNGDVEKLRIHFEQEFGRIRVVAMGPDGMMYIATSNRDGRGRPQEGDDRIIRIDPAVFLQ